MKSSILLLTAAFGLLLVPTTTRADETPLGKQMEATNDAYKALRRETDPAKGAALAREAQEAILKGIPELPELVKSMADGEAKSKATATYRKLMGQVFVALCEVEEAFLAKDLEKVKTLVDTLKDLKKEGHDQFMDEE